MNIQTGDEHGLADTRRPTSRCCASSATSCAAAASARCSPIARASTVVDGLEPGLRRRRGVLVLRERRHGRLLRATSTPGLTGEDDSYQGALRIQRRSLRRAGRPSLRRRQLQSGGRLRPARQLPRARSAALRFSPRPRHRAARAQVHLGSAARVHRRTAPARSRRAQQIGAVQHRVRERAISSPSRSTRNYELLVDPFAIATGVTIPRGGYDFSDVAAAATPSAPQRRASGAVTLQRGGFYDGDITALSFSSGRVSVTRQLVARAELLDQPRRAARRRLHHARCYRTRADYGFSPRMFASALAAVQLRRPRLQQQSAFPLGIPARAASCSSSTPTSATRPAPVTPSQEPRLRRESQPPVPFLIHG